MQLSLPWSSWPLSRSGAFTLHVAISLLVFSSLVAMMLLFWFPGELFFIDGGWQGLKLVAMVDLVLGPALTLLLYKPKKPKLMLDMSLIAGIQIAALAYGFYTTHQQRTLAVVFAERTFFTVSANDNLKANAQLRKLDIEPQPVPKALMLEVPLLLTPDPKTEEYGQFLVDIMNGYPGPHQRNDLYVLLENHTNTMTKHALNSQKLERLGVSSLVAASLAKQSLDQDDVEFYNFTARYSEGVVIFDPETVSILDYISTDNIIKPTKESATVAKRDELPL
ncbi:MAG: hypothetical protein ACI8VW_000034 [bacterium]